MNDIIRIGSSVRRTGSRGAAIKTSKHDVYAVEARLAGVTLAMTRSAAKRLARQLETISRGTP